ncbi:hypothetical protein SEPCBS57363_006494 [Sporothrix epigloea]|uniref:Transcriptional regulator n=1 Tax=Sporothrix epigloea TaxID=1892477 RepID=A0ABP0E7L0_9PEZI
MSSDAKLEKALIDATRNIFCTDQDSLTVNAVRTRAECNLDLDEGFFKLDSWKSRSKLIIQTEADKLLKGDSSAAFEPETEARDTKPAPKKAKSATTSAHPKEIKRPATQKTKPAAKKRKDLSKKQRIIESSDEEKDSDDDDHGSDEFSDGPSDDGDDSVDESLNDEDDFEDEGAARRKRARTTDKSKARAKAKTAIAKAVPTFAEDAASPSEPARDTAEAKDDDESEMSDIIDEPPKRKRAKNGPALKSKDAKRKADASDSSLSVPGSPSRKRGKKEGSSATSSSAVLSPEDAEVKKLQGQLVKCGVRKIWAFELKSCGDDAKAKVRHLKNMLRDIGMDGRFSESRAREIKERRELEADLEAVQEMDRNWGTHGRNGRPSRSRQQKSLKEDSLSEDEDGQSGNGAKDTSNGKDEDSDAAEEKEAIDEDEDGAPSTLRRRRFGDLAFLGSDSESDSE